MIVIRCFLAVKVNDVLKEIKPLLLELYSTKTKVKWVMEENLHITLKFLGEVELEKLKVILDNLGHVYSKSSPFELEISGMGAFPNIEYPKIIWIGTRKGSQMMNFLHVKTEELLSSFNIKKDRNLYTPHLTVGRVKNEQNIEQLKRIIKANENRFFGSVTVEQVELLKSELKPHGPVYSVVQTFSLS